MKLKSTLSIRSRLLLWFGALLVCILGGFGTTVFQLERTQVQGRINAELDRRLALLQEDWRSSVPPSDSGPGGPGGPGGPVGPPGGKGGPPGPGGPRLPGAKDGKRAPREFDGPGPREWDGAGPRDGDGGPERSRGPRLRLAPQTTALFADESREAFYYATWRKGGISWGHSANAPVEIPAPTEAARGQRFERMRAGSCERYYFTELGDCVLTGISLGESERATRRFGWWLLAAGVGVLAVGLGGTWLIAARALRPVKDIGSTARRIAAGNLAERIAAPDAASELRELADVLNSTFARLEAAFAEQKNFTADASHELRTPIAALVTAMQGLLTRERSGEEYRETVAACLRTVQQMRRLTESLLALARFDAGQEVTRREPVDLGEVVRASVELLRPLAEARKIAIFTEEEAAAVVVRGDEERLGQVITNLVANAVHYNRDGGEVRVSTRVDGREGRAGREVCVRVADNGRGITAEDLPHVFERFYRADKARSWSEGRSGLGLAICKAIVEAHGGTIEVASVAGAGATFTVRLVRDGE